jgi:hypothetical protein
MDAKKNVLLFLPFCFILLLLPFESRGENSVKDERCYSCHGYKEFTGYRAGREVTLYVDERVIERSVHARSRCTSCHVDASGDRHEKGLTKVHCGSCHEDEERSYQGSIHGIDFSKGETDVPGCTTCHGNHDILPVDDPKSRSFSLNIVTICLNCHEDEKIDTEHVLPGMEYIKAYRESVHGRAIKRAGLNVAAVCPDCHGNHKILPADNPESRVNKLQIPADCGKCHPGIQKDFEESIHGRGLRAGIMDSPVCTDCHGEHTIAKITDPAAKVYAKNIPATCGSCHESEVISSRYALPKKRFSTFMDSFHGIALEYGMTKTANCASCHGYHLVLPSSNPKSTINIDNIPETCGQCHPNASENFARGKIHVEVSREGHKGVWMVRVFYTLFIGALALLFVLHISFDFIERKRHRKKVKADSQEEKK